MAGVIIIWVILAIACCSIAKNKGMNGALWFCIGLAFGVFALGVVILLPSKNN